MRPAACRSHSLTRVPDDMMPALGLGRVVAFVQPNAGTRWHQSRRCCVSCGTFPKRRRSCPSRVSVSGWHAHPPMFGNKVRPPSGTGPGSSLRACRPFPPPPAFGSGIRSLPLPSGARVAWDAIRRSRVRARTFDHFCKKLWKSRPSSTIAKSARHTRRMVAPVLLRVHAGTVCPPHPSSASTHEEAVAVPRLFPVC